MESKVIIKEEIKDKVKNIHISPLIHLFQVKSQKYH